MTARVSTTGRLLRQLACVAASHPVWTLTLAVLLAAGVIHALTTLTLATSQRDLLPQGQPCIQLRRVRNRVRRPGRHSRRRGRILPHRGQGIRHAARARAAGPPRSPQAHRLFAARPTLDTLVQGISSQVASGFASGFLDLGLSESKGPVDLRSIQDLLLPVLLQILHPRLTSANAPDAGVRVSVGDGAT